MECCESYLSVRDEKLFQVCPPNDDSLQAGASTEVQFLELMGLDDELCTATPWVRDGPISLGF